MILYTAWKGQSVPKDWTDAVLIPIPKKRDLSNCDKRRGISLLYVVGKGIARILQDRLQELAEEELSESSAVLQRQRVLRHYICCMPTSGKSWEHWSKTFFLYNDL